VEPNHSPLRADLDYATIVEHEAAKMVAAVTRGPVDARVPGCPDWNLGELAVHVGQVHRWATGIVQTGEPGDMDAGPDDPADSAPYLAAGVGPLVAALRAADQTAPCWNFTRANLTKAFWLRRQAHETVAHRWDAESAVGTATPIDAMLASDAIDEWAHALVRRVVGRASSAMSTCTARTWPANGRSK
jgi:uncharacterized protein (TIGR03083 family)